MKAAKPVLKTVESEEKEIMADVKERKQIANDLKKMMKKDKLLVEEED